MQDASLEVEYNIVAADKLRENMIGTREKVELKPKPLIPLLSILKLMNLQNW
jgi:hypothetical protein